MLIITGLLTVKYSIKYIITDVQHDYNKLFFNYNVIKLYVDIVDYVFINKNQLLSMNNILLL
jgi:hypothetical protein